MGSQASYKDVLNLLQSRDIQVRAVLVDSGALPGFRQLDNFHLPDQGRNNILRKVRSTPPAGPTRFPNSRGMRLKKRMRKSLPKPAINTLWATARRP